MNILSFQNDKNRNHSQSSWNCTDSALSTPNPESPNAQTVIFQIPFLFTIGLQISKKKWKTNELEVLFGSLKNVLECFGKNGCSPVRMGPVLAGMMAVLAGMMAVLAGMMAVLTGIMDSYGILTGNFKRKNTCFFIGHFNQISRKKGFEGSRKDFAVLTGISRKAYFFP